MKSPEFALPTFPLTCFVIKNSDIVAPLVQRVVKTIHFNVRPPTPRSVITAFTLKDHIKRRNCNQTKGTPSKQTTYTALWTLPLPHLTYQVIQEKWWN